MPGIYSLLYFQLNQLPHSQYNFTQGMLCGACLLILLWRWRGGLDSLPFVHRFQVTTCAPRRWRQRLVAAAPFPSWSSFPLQVVPRILHELVVVGVPHHIGLHYLPVSFRINPKHALLKVKPNKVWNFQEWNCGTVCHCNGQNQACSVFRQ